STCGRETGDSGDRRALRLGQPALPAAPARRRPPGRFSFVGGRSAACLAAARAIRSTHMSRFRFVSAGESHGPQLTVIVTGMPAGGRLVLERASARETASRVAAGAIAKELLRAFGVDIRSGVVSVGAAGDPEASPTFDELGAVDDESPLRAVNREHEAAMVAEVDRAREAGETLGGTIVAAARGVPPGLGSYVQWDEKLDGRIGQAILSIHAVKAVAVGDGVAASRRVGSEVHDAIYYDDARRYHRNTNRAGGLEGGVTNGQDVVVRAFM